MGNGLGVSNQLQVTLSFDSLSKSILIPLVFFNFYSGRCVHADTFNEILVLFHG